jgi:type IV pilus assembly protein PilB
MLTLTLLDGTTIKLPTPTATAEETSTEHHLTTRDLVQALLARAEGKDVSDVLRDAHWETLFATLISLLLKKGLVADWEFVEEWTKMRRTRET